MTIDSILTSISATGFLIRACGQCSPILWYAILHRFDDDGLALTPTLTAPTLAQALALALAAIPSARVLPYATPAPVAPGPVLDLATLGLAPRSAPTFHLTRRLRAQ